jgi:hypothetical protein
VSHAADFRSAALPTDPPALECEDVLLSPGAPFTEVDFYSGTARQARLRAELLRCGDVRLFEGLSRLQRDNLYDAAGFRRAVAATAPTELVIEP